MANPTVFSGAVKRIGLQLQEMYHMDAETFHDLLPRERSHWKIFEGMQEKWLSSLEE